MLFNIIFKQYLNIFIRNFVLCIQIRFVSTEKTTRIASRASCVIYKIALEFSTNVSYMSESSVEITLKRGSNRSTESIDLKIGLDLENWVIHV